jgi:bifunctional DNA-binding transcriptional regulator/antitoxin component of YhaV-PrlF toxin-antitoxin module
VLLDKQGRVTIPKYLLDALGVDRSDENAPLVIEAHPNLENTKSLIVKKG